jgi:predicted enzyme related to lactoylglutathione lyase
MQAPIAWHQLHSRDAERAMLVYGELFGWVHTETLDVADLEGGYRLFAFDRGGEPAGAVANTARWPGVHTHWQFYFPVPDLDAAVDRVRALGGKAFDPVAVPACGFRLAACDDPQGAAFGLLERMSP